MDAIELQNLVIGYSKEKEISQSLNLSIKQGEIIAFIGRNGIGKSTLIKTINGALAPLKGEVTIHGKEIGRLNQGERSRLIATVSTNSDTITHYTVRESIALGRFPFTNFLGTLSHEDEAIIAETAQLLKLEPLLGNRVSELSDGEKQRVAIARALVQETPFLLLDEPTSHLDYPNRIELFQHLQNISHNKSIGVLLCTHEVNLCQQFCDQLWCFYTDGRVVSYKPKEITAETLNKVFSTSAFGIL